MSWKIDGLLLCCFFVEILVCFGSGYKIIQLEVKPGFIYKIGGHDNVIVFLCLIHDVVPSTKQCTLPFIICRSTTEVDTLFRLVRVRNRMG